LDDIDESRMLSENRQFALAEVPYDRDHPALHDFFHAAWIWTIAGEWYLVPAL